MFRALLLATTASLTALSGAQASVVTMDTRASAAGPQASAAAYRTLIDGLVAAPASRGYGSTTVSTYDNLSNRGVLGGSGSDIAFRYTVTFNVATAGTWDFRFGVDFGRGGAVFLDGLPVAFRNTDMWWAGSYADPTQSFQFSSLLAAGNHVLTIYGLEGCCDGGQQGQFRAPGQAGFTTFSATDGLTPVPEPTTLALFGASLLGLAAARRRSG